MSIAREQQILRALAGYDRELHGSDLVEAGAARVNWLYVVLARLEDRGWIEGRFEDGEPPRRRLYRITDAGRAVLTPALPVAKVR